VQLGAIVLVSCLLSEIALRVYDYFNPLFMFYDESYNRFRGRPLADDWDFKLNSRGFKDVEFFEKRPGAHRILGLGDSFAFGVVPYRHNYLTLLEERLQRDNPAAEVLNVGIPGTGPRDYLALLVREGLALEPDAVLLSFFVGNDFDESWRGERPLYSYSYVASLIHYLFQVLPKYEGTFSHGKAEYCDDCPNLDEEAYLGLVGARSLIYLEEYQDFSKVVDNAAYYLARIRDLCARKGIELFVVIIPDEVQFGGELQRRVRERFFPRQTWNNTRPITALAARLERLGIPYLDLYPHFAAEASGTALYRPRDTHWTIRGNRLAAEVIFDWLRPSMKDPRALTRARRRS
jgi:lysophospholipase L1-like esterase